MGPKQRSEQAKTAPNSPGASQLCCLAALGRPSGRSFVATVHSTAIRHRCQGALPRLLLARWVGKKPVADYPTRFYSRRALDDLTSLHRRRAPDEQHSEPVTGGWQSGACFGIHSICCTHSPLVQMTSIVHWMQLHGPLCRPAADGQSTPLTSRAGAACAWLLDTLVGCFAAGL